MSVAYISYNSAAVCSLQQYNCTNMLFGPSTRAGVSFQPSFWPMHNNRTFHVLWSVILYRMKFVMTIKFQCQDTLSDADIQHLWRQSVRSCRPRTMEQSSVAPERRWHIVQWISVVTSGQWSLKTFLFGQWGHGAVWTVLTAPTRNILTYLLT